MILTPPEFKNQIDGKLVFLAGPIQGALDWQKRAIELLLQDAPDLNIANPRGDHSSIKFDYDIQVDWEFNYLVRASVSGGILFWLAKEHTHLCNRSYAQTTRSELSEWIAKYKLINGIKLFVGIEDGFTGARYIRKRMKRDCPRVIIHSNLEDLCREVARGVV